MTLPSPSPIPAANAAAPPHAAAPLAARRGFITLDEGAWAQIRTEYLAGATGKQISQKWGCSRVAVYDHASKGGWTKRARGRAISASVLEEMQGERAARAQRAAAPPPEASPLVAAKVLLRRAAAAALLGESGAAFEGVKLAESLARAARLLSDAETGVAESRAALLAEARAALEDDPDYAPPGWDDSAEAQAMEATILQGLSRQALARGRTPPQRLPLWFMLDGNEALRPLAEALGLVVQGQAWVECPDFELAVQRAREAGRGEAVDLALSTPTPLEHCLWLSDEAKAEAAAREAEAVPLAEAAAAEVASGDGWRDAALWESAADEVEGEVDGAEAPSIRRLHHEDEPWRAMPRRRPGRISEPSP